ncbi:ribokinase [Kurthia sibirica]|uniref:Ribokinase n=1 Tax=Kurthia sibirica TaxID=202750 RepID=A0A2U3AN91_9BACL|nr:ribokinase [Kurthia sibirica]PWI25985.1 ribokinase [Kurthia sibirica]GEK34982.1 ribokinase [Kurthia sibirica]
MITIIGSINMDIVTETTIFPKQGETILGNKFTTVPGGKGANQAVAAARLHHPVQMIGRVGADEFGSSLYNNLNNEKINTKFVKETTCKATGIANILLYEGDNRIIVVAGANDEVTIEAVDEAMDAIKNSAIVVLQLEIPQQTVTYIINICHELNIPVLLNPAPSERFEHQWMDKLTYFTPNESECHDLFGDDLEGALMQYPNKLIVTLGDKGARFYDGKQHQFIAGCPSTVVDTTGAGDTFNGAFAFCIAEGYKIGAALQFANAAASLSVEKFGAQGGMPTLADVQFRLNNMK